MRERGRGHAFGEGHPFPRATCTHRWLGEGVHAAPPEVIRRRVTSPADGQQALRIRRPSPPSAAARPGPGFLVRVVRRTEVFPRRRARDFAPTREQSDFTPHAAPDSGLPRMCLARSTRSGRAFVVERGFGIYGWRAEGSAVMRRGSAVMRSGCASAVERIGCLRQ